MIYLDTSCLHKLFRLEAQSPAVRSAIGAENSVVISQLTELETLVQLKAGWKGGDFSRSQWRRFELELGLMRNQPPFEFRLLPAALFQAALRQHQNSGDVHCRSLDRLHLAAMEELGLTRLMTHDESQATAAEAMGFKVVRPGRD